MKGVSIRSHSLTLENCAYLDRIAKGHKSAAVNSALTWYRGQGVEVHELLANIEALQAIITDLGESSLPQKSTSLMGGLRAIITRMWPF